MKILTHLDLNQNELRNAVLQPLATPPENPIMGQLYYNSAQKKLYQYDGEKWRSSGTVEISSENGSIIVDGVEIPVYELPTASSETLGGVKTGQNITVDESGVVSYNMNAYQGIREDDETDDEVIARVLGETIPYEGDIFVIKTLIQDDKYSYSSFVYDEAAWVAMDGNVDATNVILREDLVTAGNYTQVGNITKGATATGSISAAGKSVADVFKAIFTKELNPTATAPAVTITFAQAGTEEVGTVITPTYSCTLSAGSYTYGPATGITATSWTVTDTSGNSAATASGSFPEMTVEDNTSYKITATAEHGAGAIPVTNLGTEYADAQIAAGSKSKTSGALTGYRSFFYGSTTDKSSNVDSAFIRSLTNANKAVGTSQTFEMSIVDGTKRVIIAFPVSTSKVLSKVEDQGAFGTDIVASFTDSEVNVEGKNNYTAIPYKVYAYEPAAALSANTYKVTIA